MDCGGESASPALPGLNGDSLILVYLKIVPQSTDLGKRVSVDFGARSM
jgi:hypothetical protein